MGKIKIELGDWNDIVTLAILKTGRLMRKKRMIKKHTKKYLLKIIEESVRERTNN